MPALTSAIVGISAVAGLGLSAVGAYEKYQGAKDQANASSNIAGLETQQDAVRRQAMEVQARRQVLEGFRNQQRSRASALAAANSRGAIQSSGLQGGYGQIGGQFSTNITDIYQHLQSGENMFDLNSQINQQKMNYAQAGSTIALGSGLSSLGGGILSNLGTIKSFSQGFGVNPGQPQGYGQFVNSIGSNGIY